MLSKECLFELKSEWLPNVTDCGLDSIIDLLETNSPLLIHGSFTRAIPMGCLASHIAWHHPKTEQMTLDAGICWLNRVAKLNPATSRVIREWDDCASYDYEVRQELLQIFRAERASRQKLEDKIGVNRIADLVEA